jgi:hypothetical protein
MDGGEQKCTEGLVGNPGGKNPLGRPVINLLKPSGNFTYDQV